MAQGYSQSQLDAMARQAGYRSYAEWQAAKKRKAMDTEQRRMQAGGAAPASSRNSTAEQEPRNFLQRFVDTIPGNPFSKTKKALNQANKK